MKRSPRISEKIDPLDDSKINCSPAAGLKTSRGLAIKATALLEARHL
ncbi:MAG: hypothetical protein WCI09_01330 [Planctomycetota bacterium]